MNNLQKNQERYFPTIKLNYFSETLTISIKDNIKSREYTKNFNKELLYSLNKVFTSFQTLEEIKNSIDNIINEKKIKYFRKKASLIISFTLLNEKVSLEIQKNSSVTSKIKNEKEKEEILKKLEIIKKKFETLQEEKENLKTLYHQKLIQKKSLETLNKKLKNLNFDKFIEKKNINQQDNMIQEQNNILSLEILSLPVSFSEKYSGVTSIVCLIEEKIAFSTKNIVIIFNLLSKQGLLVLEHQDIVNNICEISYELIGSCSRDKTIRIWNSTTGKCLQILKNHNDSVNKVIMVDKKLISCSTDKTARVWCLKGSFFEECKIQFHTEDITSVINLKGKTILVFSTGEKDRFIFFWDIKKSKTIKIIYDIFSKSSNGLFELDEKKLLVGGLETVSVINSDTFEVEQYIQSNYLKDVSSFVQLNDGSIICGCQDGYLCQLSPKIYECVKQRKISYNNILCLGYSGYQLIGSFLLIAEGKCSISCYCFL